MPSHRHHKETFKILCVAGETSLVSWTYWRFSGNCSHKNDLWVLLNIRGNIHGTHSLIEKKWIQKAGGGQKVIDVCLGQRLGNMNANSITEEGKEEGTVGYTTTVARLGEGDWPSLWLLSYSLRNWLTLDRMSSPRTHTHLKGNVWGRVGDACFYSELRVK